MTQHHLDGFQTEKSPQFGSCGMSKLIRGPGRHPGRLAGSMNRCPIGILVVLVAGLFLGGGFASVESARAFCAKRAKRFVSLSAGEKQKRRPRKQVGSMKQVGSEYRLGPRANKDQPAAAAVCGLVARWAVNPKFSATIDVPRPQIADFARPAASEPLETDHVGDNRR